MADYIFGITGATGAGKSTVSRLFIENGIYVADADLAARAVVKPGMPCFTELVNVFGDKIVNEDGTLNRRELAQIVFGNENNLKLLNSITHTYITEYLKNEIEKSGAEIAAIDGAVIIGSPVEKLCRMLVVVTADEEVRLQRITARDKITPELAKARMAAQMSNGEYKRHGTYFIENNGDINRLGVQIEHICFKIKAALQAEDASKAKTEA